MVNKGGIILNRLREISENLAHKRKIFENVENFKNRYPGIIENGLSTAEWKDLRFVIRNSGTCRCVVIKNLDKLDFIETYFRLRVYYLKKKQKNEFLNFLKKSKLLLIKTIIRIKKLDLETVRSWDSEIEKSDFEKTIKDFPYTFIIPTWFMNLVNRTKDVIMKVQPPDFNRICRFFSLLLFIFLISLTYAYTKGLDIWARVTIIGSIASTFGFLFTVLIKES